LKLSRIDAAAHLGISVATLDRWIAKGKLTAIYGEPNRMKKRAVFIEFEDLGSEPEPVTVAPEPQPEPKPTVKRKVLSDVELKQLDDLAFTEEYLAGEKTDSCGNFHGGYNARYTGTQTLIGAREPQPREKLSTTAHMTPGTVPSPGPSANEQYINSLEYALACGRITQETYDAMTGNASKARIPEQTAKEFVDRRAIHAAFRYGYSR
jgi:hypothetical protein